MGGILGGTIDIGDDEPHVWSVSSARAVNQFFT